MFNTTLFWFLLVIVSTMGVQASPADLKIALGSTDTRVGNTSQIETPSNVTNSVEGVKIIDGETGNVLVSIGRVKEIYMYLPPGYGSENGMPRRILINGTSLRKNIINPVRRQSVQRSIDNLKKSCSELKQRLYPLMDNGKYIPDIARIIQSVIAEEMSLLNQQKILDDFEISNPWSPPKRDYFDRDLKTLSQTIDRLNVESLSFTQSNV